LFLSLRFTASRDWAYNEYIYTFFKCLSEERLRYAESSSAVTGPRLVTGAPARVMRAHEAPPIEEWCQIDGWRVQGRCPHLQGDLSRFGAVDADDVLTCKLHGYQFDLVSGKCLTTGEEYAIKADRVQP
jgi:UDP-MurNAc hydroxylase